MPQPLTLTAHRIDSARHPRRKLTPNQKCYTCGRPKSRWNADQDCYACQEKRRDALEGVRYKAGAPFGRAKEPYVHSQSDCLVS